MDQFLRQHKEVEDFTGQEEEYKLILRLLANKRYRRNEEQIEDCYRRLRRENRRFVRIYHERGSKFKSMLCSQIEESRRDGLNMDLKTCDFRTPRSKRQKLVIYYLHTKVFSSQC